MNLSITKWLFLSYFPIAQTQIHFSHMDTVSVLKTILRTYIINSHVMGVRTICRGATHAPDISWRFVDGQMEPLPLHNSFAVKSTYAANQIQCIQMIVTTMYMYFSCHLYSIYILYIICMYMAVFISFLHPPYICIYWRGAENGMA